MESNFEFGEIKISNDVISSIVAIAVEETEGFKLVKTLVDKVMSKNQAVKVTFTEDENLIVTVSVNVKYGLNIHEVAPTVQDNIISNVEIMTGLEVKEININVDGLYFEQQPQTQAK